MNTAGGDSIGGSSRRDEGASGTGGGSRRSVAARFSAAAGTYDRDAQVQDTVARRLVALIQDRVPPDSLARILEIGCGTGLMTAMLCAGFPGVPLYAMDCSYPMVARARVRGPAVRGVRWLVADAAGFPARQPFSLVASSSALHWIGPPRDVFRRVGALLAPDGYLGCAVMLEGTLGELRDSRLRVAPAKPPRGRLSTKAEIEDGLREAGLAVRAEQEEDLRAEYASAADLLRGIHRQGLTGGAVSGARAPLSRTEIRALEADYDARYRSAPRGVFATYRPLYVLAQRSPCVGEAVLLE